MNLLLTLFRHGCFFACFEEGGVGRVLAHSITLKPLILLSPKFPRIIYSSFLTSRHNLIDTISLYVVIMTSYCWIYGQNPNCINFFPLQSEKYLNNKMSDHIEKLVKTLVTFNNSSDLMMMSIMVKGGSGTIRHLGSHHFEFSKGIQFYLKQVEVEVIIVEKMICV